MKNDNQDQLKDLKAILYSKRANIYYLEKCRVLVKDGRVTYLTQVKDKYFYYNIPIANTTFILLGTGTSITQSAVRYLASAGVMIGFVGSDGTPFYAGTEIEWLSSKSEYRPTSFLQQWVSFYYNDEIRLEAAKKFQLLRISFIQKIYSKDRFFHENGFTNDNSDIANIIDSFMTSIEAATSVNELLLHEARFTKSLYKIACKNREIKNFTRDRESGDLINQNLNQGNYLAYGLAALALWALGIPPAFALFHGKTRRGALVFDVADLIKDAIVLPLSFSMNGDTLDDSNFREQCIKYFTDYSALEYMFDAIELTAKEFSQIKKKL